MTDANIDQAILESRVAGARLSSCASAVDHRGRREVVAREVRCRRARPVPAAANDEKPETTTVFKGRSFTVDPDDPTSVIVRTLEGDPDGRDPPTAS